MSKRLAHFNAIGNEEFLKNHSDEIRRRTLCQLCEAWETNPTCWSFLYDFEIHSELSSIGHYYIDVHVVSMGLEDEGLLERNDLEDTVIDLAGMAHWYRYRLTEAGARAVVMLEIEG